jgi:hypothetical protein
MGWTFFVVHLQIEQIEEFLSNTERQSEEILGFERLIDDGNDVVEEKKKKLVAPAETKIWPRKFWFWAFFLAFSVFSDFLLFSN